MEQYWSKFAGNYDARQSAVVGKYCVEQVKRKLSDMENLGFVLEFGCGNGGYTKYIVDNAVHVTATDFSKEMLTEAQHVFAGNDKVTFEQADCHKTRFNDNSFDTVFMANLIHIIDDPTSVVMEAKRVLRRNGHLIITSFTTEQMRLFDKIGLLYRYLKTFGAFPKERTPFTTKTLESLLMLSGFTIAETDLLGKNVKSLFIRALLPREPQQ